MLPQHPETTTFIPSIFRYYPNPFLCTICQRNIHTEEVTSREFRENHGLSHLKWINVLNGVDITIVIGIIIVIISFSLSPPSDMSSFLHLHFTDFCFAPMG
uniref:Uncharacterized protein n=1 Tax=Trypanosoma congolense (strain IL3000) TaxID=1068625 RepID=G0UMU5_TRYCI|nr:hypothetical protein, unlikely [Trypanosoma congolense IL3000]